MSISMLKMGIKSKMTARLCFAERFKTMLEKRRCFQQFFLHGKQELKSEGHNAKPLL